MVAVTPHHGLLVTTLLVLGAGGGVAQEPVPGVDAILARVGARLERHYERARRIVSTEEVWVRSFTREMRAYGSPRWLEFEHRVEWAAEEAGGVPVVTVRRDLRSVDGRKPTQEDLEACLTPESIDEDPLSALLPARQGEFEFSLSGTESVSGRQVAQLAYVPLAAGPAEITWEDGCVSLSLPGRSRGEVWVDVATGDVLRLDERLMRRFEFREPQDRPRRHWGPLALERSESSTRYERVTFDDPEETFMLPRSIESSWTMQGTGFLPRYVRSQQFSDHRRFVSEGRILQTPGN